MILSDVEKITLAELATGGNVLELGSWVGGSAILMASTARHVCAIDSFIGEDGRWLLPQCANNVIRAGAFDRVCVHPGWFENVLPSDREIQSTPYQMVFLDGDHSAGCVRRDLQLIFRYVQASFIVCHDYGLYETASGIAAATVGRPWELTNVIDTLAILQKVV